jgi:hypothetical protein
MGSFNIDGRSFTGRSVIIRNGVVTIDGVRQDGTLNGVVEIKITEGVIERLECDSTVSCGEVRGAVRAGMEVRCGNVTGDVQAGMSVTCDTVGGSVTAGMGVSMRR